MQPQEPPHTNFSARTKRTLAAVAFVLTLVFLFQVRTILSPFLWALVVAYLLSPVVNYLVRGGLPRLFAVALLYVSLGLALVGASRYLYPGILDQRNLLLEDIPKLQASLEGHFGTKPLGLNIDGLVRQLLSYIGASDTGGANAGKRLVSALETAVKIFLFLVTTFYLLLDAPRLRRAAVKSLPKAYRHELLALGQQINLTWQQYIRGEIVLFVIMAGATTIGLTILRVPGALFVGLASGALELLPLVGPLTAGALAVSVAYFNGTNPWGWDQVAYAGAVAAMYFVLRQAEDYFVIPHVLGRAVRLHPLVVLFAVATGGVAAGLLGLVLAVPVAASIKATWTYLYAKMLDLPVEFQPVRTLGGGFIEIPIHGRGHRAQENSAPESAGSHQPIDAV